MDRIEHNHAFGNLGRVIMKSTAACVTAPDFECGSCHRDSLNRES
jgi:hypothetical protein